jgi:hypothetical protein
MVITPNGKIAWFVFFGRQKFRFQSFKQVILSIGGTPRAT